MNIVPSSTNDAQNSYRLGLESAVRTIGLAPPENLSVVFEQQAEVVAGFVRSGGLDKVDAVDRLNTAALTFGLTEVVGQDVVQATLANAMGKAVPPKQLPAHPRPRLVPILWSEIHRLPRRESLVGGLLDRRGELVPVV